MALIGYAWIINISGLSISRVLENLPRGFLVLYAAFALENAFVRNTA